MHLGLVAVVVSEYDPASSFFVDVLGFELAEDSPARTNDGRAKRWVVVRPPGAETGLLLARADGEEQAAAVGRQAAGRVGFFLRYDGMDQDDDGIWTTPGGDKVACFADPDGNTLSLTEFR